MKTYHFWRGSNPIDYLSRVALINKKRTYYTVYSKESTGRINVDRNFKYLGQGIIYSIRGVKR